MRINGKVKRLKSDCCGMKVGRVYEAHFDHGLNYVRVKLDDGIFTQPHWVPTWFEILSVDEETPPHEESR